MSASPRTRSAALLALALLVLTLTGCQVQVVVGVDVNDDASGTVRVSIALDADASAEAGDIDEALRLDDLRAAGWSTVEPDEPVEADEAGEPVEADEAGEAGGGEGKTWVRMEKPFADPDAFTAVMGELNPTVFRDFVLVKDSGTFGTTYSITGTIDLTGGLRSFSDGELDAVEGDPVGAEIAAIEQREGRPATEMVEVSMVIQLPGRSDPVTYTPSFADEAPTEVDASSSTGSLLSSLGFWVLTVLVIGTVLVVLRSAFLRFRR